jgi:integrase
MTTTRNKPGTVGVERKCGKLRIRLPRTVTSVNTTRYISTGYDDTVENWRAVQTLAWAIEADIRNGTFDCSLVSYHQIIKRPTVNRSPNLMELWAAYCEHRKPSVAITTYRHQYLGYYTNHIRRLPSHNITDAITIRNYITQTLSVTVAHLVLTQLNACCRWALSDGLINSNPFAGMTSLYSLARQRWNSNDIDPFSRSERDAIITAYREHPTHHHYHNFIAFLFATGCRPGEACALRWHHINDTHILFAETYNARHRLTKETKTGKVRRFPINEPLRQLLNNAANNHHSNYLFTTHHAGLPINNEKIPQLLKWREIVTRLVEDGQVQRYRPPYTCRSTFITLALEAGLTVPQVARLVGNTPTVLLKHYAGNTVADVPVF